MKHIARSRHSHWFAPAATRWLVLPALIGLVACGSDAMSLGSNEAAVEEGECLAGEITGDLVASTQADVDALSGCRELPGSLRIMTPAFAPGSISLEPLAELRRVNGQLQIGGPITSLAGLESLEAVGMLHLRDTQLTDLTPLRGLTRVETPTDWRAPHILIDGCDQLSDLRGLENLSVWSSLEISRSNGLVSLAGLQAPERLESVILNYAPQLSDLSALASVREIGLFTLTGSAVVGFGGFLLDSIGTLYLFDNAALTDFDGLNRLAEIGDLAIVENDALVRIDLPELNAFDNVTIIGNDALLAVPPLDTDNSWSNVVSGIADVPTGFVRGVFEVGDNPLVASIAMPNLFNAEAVVIYRNPSLTTLDMTGLFRTDSMWIEENATLASVNASSLDRVSSLTIRNNPALSVAPFAAVQTFTSDVAGNLDAPAP